MRYAVETEFVGGWENCWSDEEIKDGVTVSVPTTFETRDDAEMAIRDHIKDCIEAVEGGDMEDSPDPSEFRVVEVQA